MIKVLANDGISKAGQDMLEKAGYEVNITKIPQDELATKLNEYDVVLVRSATKIRKDLIDQCPNIKLIGRGGVGLDNIDVDYAKSKGIDVVNTPAASSQSVAELVIGNMFAVSRFLHNANREMPAKGATEFKALKKSYSKGSEVKGKTLGIIGLGRIGRAAASMAMGLGMKVLAHDPFVDKSEIVIEGFGDHIIKVPINTVPKAVVLAASDYLTLHVPAGEKPVLGAEEFAQMKSTAILINAARGGVVDEDALLEALNNDKLGGAALDVFVGEPTPRQDLLNHPKIALTPHTGASTKEAQDNIGIELAEKIMAKFEK